MQEYGKLSTIKESPGKYPSSKDALHELLKDHETIVQHLRKDIIEITKNSHDLGTADFLTGLLEHHETTAWILRRYLN